MPEFLILEDEKATRVELGELLTEEFPQAWIDVTCNLEDAARLAKEIGERGEYYDVALLDVLVPLDGSGGGAEIFPEERRELLDALGYKTVVVNYSAFAYQERIQQFINAQKNANGPMPLLIDASPSRRWHEEVLNHCRRVVYGRRIAEQLAQVLRSGHAALVRCGAVAARAGRGAGEQALADLTRDIKLHWADLDEGLRERIRNTFDIREVDGEVLVNF